MNKFLVVSLAVVSFVLNNTVQIQAAEVQKPVELKAEASAVNLDMVVKDNYIKAKYSSAENRFIQSNVKASHDDFEDLISKAVHDDYVFMAYAIKMAEFGFFDLSEELISKLDDNLYTKNYVKDLKKFYYPSGMVEPQDVIYLSDAYAGIVYNNLALETTSELINNPRASESDYKNYLIALGSYKSNNLVQALKYINNAISENDVNVNYKILKARILADSDKPAQAKKVLAQINHTVFKTADFQNKVKSAEEYILYKSAKNETLKDYHLGYYYHLQNKSLLASKVLQGAILQAKEHSSEIFGLLSRVYYENDEPLKAQEFAQRSYKDNKRNYFANLTLGDLNYDERKYDEALKYYKAARKASKDNVSAVGMAKSYLELNQNKKSEKIINNLLKKYADDEDVLIGALKAYPQKAYDLMPIIASIDLTNNEIWLNLANLAIKDGNLKMAETYLNNSYYIDENNFKYYYYLSQVYKANGDLDKSNLSLVKCTRLNSDYEASLKGGNLKLKNPNSGITSGYSVYEK